MTFTLIKHLKSLFFSQLLTCLKHSLKLVHKMRLLSQIEHKISAFIRPQRETQLLLNQRTQLRASLLSVCAFPSFKKPPFTEQVHAGHLKEPNSNLHV